MNIVENKARQKVENIGLSRPGGVSAKPPTNKRPKKSAAPGRPKKAKKASSGESAAKRTSGHIGTTVRIRENDAGQIPEKINSPDEIKKTKPARETIKGLRIRANVSGQKREKIKRSSIKLAASDEIEYKKLFTRFEEAFIAQDMKVLGECLSPAIQWHLPNGKVIYGRKEVLQEMEHRFAMPNGPKFSGSVWKFLGTIVHQTYEVEYMGPDGKWRKSRGFDVYEIGDGLIVRKDAYWKIIP